MQMKCLSAEFQRARECESKATTKTEKQQSLKRASSLRVVAANRNVSIESLGSNNYKNRCDNKMLWALILYYS